MLPKLRESLTKHNQSIQPLIPIAGIPASAIFTGALKNYDAHCKEIWSQNTIVSGKDSDDDEDVIDEEPMEVEEDDETVGNLDLSVDDEPNQASFRSRSTILWLNHSFLLFTVNKLYLNKKITFVDIK